MFYSFSTTLLVNNITKYTRDELAPFLLRILNTSEAWRVIEIILHFVTSSPRHQVPFICPTKTKSPVETKLFTLLSIVRKSRLFFSDGRFVVGSNRPKHRPKCRDNAAKPKSNCRSYTFILSVPSLLCFNQFLAVDTKCPLWLATVFRIAGLNYIYYVRYVRNASKQKRTCWVFLRAVTATHYVVAEIIIIINLIVFFSLF